MTIFIIPALLFNKEIKIMQITPDLIKYLESLARITLTEEEERKVGGELQDILTYIDMLCDIIHKSTTAKAIAKYLPTAATFL